MKPTNPIIYIERGRFIELDSNPPSVIKVQTSLLNNPSVAENCVVYDSNGYKWSFYYESNNFKRTIWSQLLALIYTPRVKARIIWNKISEYELEELKDCIKNCIDADDDIITQFEEAFIIKKAIDTSNSYMDIINTLNKYILDDD